MRVQVAHEILLDSLLNDNQTLYLRSVVAQAISMVQDLLKVYPVSGNLGLSHWCASSYWSNNARPNMCATEPDYAAQKCGKRT